MAADIYTKGFQNWGLHQRLRQLINIYSREELGARNSSSLNPPPLGDDGKDTDDYVKDCINTQYSKITSGANSKTKIKKAVKVKAKAKPKGIKLSKLMKKTPPPVTQAFVADVTGVDLNGVNWFLRIDYGATNYLGSTDDPRCPVWATVVWRRTYNIRNGRVIQLDMVCHQDPGVTGPSTSAPVVMNGETYRLCNRHHLLIDGGLSRDIATFLYSTKVISKDDIEAELKMLNFLLPKGLRLYSAPGCKVDNTLVIFDRTHNGCEVLNTKDVVDGVWQNGFDNCRVVRLYYPIDLEFENVYETLKVIQRGMLWLIYPCSFSSSSLSILPDHQTVVKTMNIILTELSVFPKKIKERIEVQFILEVTSSVSLRASPPIFPKGFKKIFENFGGTTGHAFTIPFSGQHSCFSSSSGSLQKTSRLFLLNVTLIMWLTFRWRKWAIFKNLMFVTSMLPF